MTSLSLSVCVIVIISWCWYIWNDSVYENTKQMILVPEEWTIIPDFGVKHRFHPLILYRTQDNSTGDNNFVCDNWWTLSEYTFRSVKEGYLSNRTFLQPTISYIYGFSSSSCHAKPWILEETLLMWKHVNAINTIVGIGTLCIQFLHWKLKRTDDDSNEI